MSTLAIPSVFLGPSATVDRARERSAEAARTVPRHAVLVGTSDLQVSALLRDVLRDIHLDVALLDGDAAAEEPDVVLAMVDRGDGVRAITDARARFPKAPVVAILTLGTHRLGTRAVAAGASACYVLDMPIDRLRSVITALLKAPAPSSPRRS